ncbi:MAG TPA: hypothetical protein VKV69_08740 [Actinomycetota bacterium]|nr:hypothetical protein [Actinomycetota bacterium]
MSEGQSRTTLIVIIVLSLAVAGGVAALGVHLARDHFDRYPPAAEAGFLTQCEQSGSAQFCGCVLNAIEKKYTYKEFSAFADKFSKSGALPQGAVEALGTCSR